MSWELRFQGKVHAVRAALCEYSRPELASLEAAQLETVRGFVEAQLAVFDQALPVLVQARGGVNLKGIPRSATDVSAIEGGVLEIKIESLADFVE